MRAAAGASSCKSPSCFAARSDKVHAGCVAIRPSKAGNETKLDRIVDHAEDDGNGRGRGLSYQCRRGGACYDHSHLAAHQLRGHRRQTIVSTFGPAIFDRDIASLDVAGPGQTLAEHRHEVRN